MPSNFNTQNSNILANPAPYPDGRLASNSANANTLTGTGTTQANAAAIVAPLTTVTNNNGTVGVILPAPTQFQELVVYAAVATTGLKVYPPVGGSINGGTVNASITMEGKTAAVFYALDTTGNYAAIFTADA